MKLTSHFQGKPVTVHIHFNMHKTVILRRCGGKLLQKTTCSSDADLPIYKALHTVNNTESFQTRVTFNVYPIIHVFPNALAGWNVAFFRIVTFSNLLTVTLTSPFRLFCSPIVGALLVCAPAMTLRAMRQTTTCRFCRFLSAERVSYVYLNNANLL